MYVLVQINFFCQYVQLHIFLHSHYILEFHFFTREDLKRYLSVCLFFGKKTAKMKNPIFFSRSKIITEYANIEKFCA